MYVWVHWLVDNGVSHRRLELVFPRGTRYLTYPRRSDVLHYYIIQERSDGAFFFWYV